MITLWQSRAFHYLALIGISLCVFFLNLGGAALWDVDEGRNATCSMEMFASGNWVVPTFNGQLRVDKPALLYWLQIFSYQCFGVNEFSARLPSAFAALLAVLVTYELTRSMFTRITGLLAGVVLATTPMLCGAGRFANPDALLTAFSVLNLAIFWIGLESKRWWWFVLLGASSGLAVLAKGPVGLALPAAIQVLFLVWDRRLGIVWDWRWVLTGATFALVALPWYILVGAETHGAFLIGFFFTHNLQRGLAPMQNHGGFPGFYVVVLLVGTAPWSIFLGAAAWCGAWSAIRSPWSKLHRWWHAVAETATTETQDRVSAYRFLFCWIVMYVVFFSVAATKLPNYVLPAVIPCSILVARFVQRWWNGELVMPRWVAGSALVILFLIGIAMTSGLVIASGIGEWSFMRGRHVDGLHWFAPLGLIPILAAVAGWWYFSAQQLRRVVLVIAIGAVLTLAPIAAFGNIAFDRCRPARSLVDQSGALHPGDDLRIGAFRAGHLPSLHFYVQRNIEYLESDNGVAEFLDARLPVYLFLPLGEWRRLEGNLAGKGRIVAQGYDLHLNADLVVVCNR